MNNAGATSGATSKAANTDFERRWPVLAVFLTAWLLPATTARRTAHVSLMNAWLIHLLAAFLTILLIMLLVTWAEPGRGGLDIDEALVQFLYIFMQIDQQFARQPYVSSATLAGITISIEIGFLLLALLVMPWGAHDEPMRESYRNALRHTWLRTAHFIPCVLLVGIVGLALYHMEFEWRRTNPRYWYPWEHPWYVEYSAPIIVQTAFIAALWLMWGLFRAVRTSRHIPPIERPPICDVCGYNLTTMSMESRCPECGEAVETSLGPAARPGTVWQRRGELGRWAAWWQCSVAALFRTRKLGRQLRVVSPGTDHRRFFALHLPVVFCIGAVGIATFALFEDGVGMFVDEPAVVLMIMSMFGCAYVVGAVAFANLAAVVVGIVESLRCRRNLLPAAIQIACYLGVYLTAWALFAAVSGVAIVVLGEAYWFHALESLSGIYRDDLVGFTWLLPNAACGIWYFVLVARGTAATRYANR